MSNKSKRLKAPRKKCEARQRKLDAERRQREQRHLQEAMKLEDLTNDAANNESYFPEEQKAKLV